MFVRSSVIRHLGLPTLLSLTMIGLWFTPKVVFGCAHRGWLAAGVAGLGMLGSIVALGFAVRTMRTDRTRSLWWIASALALLLPAILMLRLA